MEKECGELQLSAPKTFSWKVGRQKSNERWRSRSFSILSNTFCFLIQPTENETESGILCLCEINNGVSNTYDLNISLTTHEIKTLLRKNTKPVKYGIWFKYKLAKIKTNNLVKITCTFLKRGIWNETIQVLGESFYKNS